MKLTTEEVFEIIAQEREYQDVKWPKPKHAHSVEEYMVYMEDYIRELKTLLTRNHEDDVYVELRHNLRKLLSLGVACAEENGLVRRGEK